MMRENPWNAENIRIETGSDFTFGSPPPAPPPPPPPSSPSLSSSSSSPCSTALREFCATWLSACFCAPELCKYRHKINGEIFGLLQATIKGICRVIQRHTTNHHPLNRHQLPSTQPRCSTAQHNPTYDRNRKPARNSSLQERISWDDLAPVFSSPPLCASPGSTPPAASSHTWSASRSA